MHELQGYAMLSTIVPRVVNVALERSVTCSDDPELLVRAAKPQGSNRRTVANVFRLEVDEGFKVV